MNILKKLSRVLLNWIFPQETIVETIVSMSPEEFLKSASVSFFQEDSYIYSIFSYHHILVEQALWQLKYHGNRDIARLFAIILYDYIREILVEERLFSDFSQPLLIPIPLSSERLKERGWNQSEMLAHELAKLDKNNFFSVHTDILKKIRHTKPQTTLSRRERLINLKDCFEVAISGSLKNKNVLQDELNIKNSVKNRNIILLDDVTTTGSTLEEASRALKLAGARRIIAFTIAH